MHFLRIFLVSYEETVLYEMLKGFQEDFPNGGIYRYIVDIHSEEISLFSFFSCRHQFESFFPEVNTGKQMCDMVFRFLTECT